MRIPKVVEVGNRLTAVKAAKRYELHVKTLTAAIDAGLVPSAERIVTGTRCIRLVDPVALGEQLAGLPRCAYVSKAGVACDRPVSLRPGSVACSGPHARGVETKGKSWRTREAIEKTSAAKRGKPRPDVRERVAAMHADKEQHYRWGVALAEGRKLPANSQRRWKGRLGGLGAGGGDGRPPRHTEEQANRLLELRREHPAWGRVTLARATGLTEKQVRRLLSAEATRP